MYVVKSITQGFQNIGSFAGRYATIITFGNITILTADEILEKCEDASLVVFKSIDGLDPFNFDLQALIEGLRYANPSIDILIETDGNHNTLKYVDEAVWITCVPKTDKIKGACICNEIVRYVYPERDIVRDTKAYVYLVPYGRAALSKCIDFIKENPVGYQLAVDLSEVLTLK